MAKIEDILRLGGNGRRSTCVAHAGLVYLSGITTVELEAGVFDQAQDIFEQIDKLLAMNGSGKNQVLSVTVYLADMADYGNFNAAWDQWITDGFEPARTVVQAGLALPGYRVKVSLVAAQQ